MLGKGLAVGEDTRQRTGQLRVGPFPLQDVSLDDLHRIADTGGVLDLVSLERLQRLLPVARKELLLQLPRRDPRGKAAAAELDGRLPDEAVEFSRVQGLRDVLLIPHSVRCLDILRVLPDRLQRTQLPKRLRAQGLVPEPFSADCGPEDHVSALADLALLAGCIPLQRLGLAFLRKQLVHDGKVGKRRRKKQRTQL